MPADYQAYLSLGRFRDALLWDTQRRTPDPEVARFLSTYVVGPFGMLESWQKEILSDQPATAAAARAP